MFAVLCLLDIQKRFGELVGIEAFEIVDALAHADEAHRHTERIGEEMTALADNIIFMTDDGSYGRKGLVTEPLKELCEDTKGKPDMVLAIGPPIMMKFCALTTKPYGVKTVVSLNSIMVDGTGMCGGCRVTIGGKTKFVCVDGPEFDGHEVDWNNMLQRMGAFKPQEQEALHRFGANDGHKCNIDKMADAKAKESK